MAEVAPNKSLNENETTVHGACGIKTVVIGLLMSMVLVSTAVAHNNRGQPQLQGSDDHDSGSRYVNLVTYLVKDYEEAIDWFTKLDFSVTQDVDMGNDTRWIVVSSANMGTSFLLAKYEGDEQLKRVGTQTGDHVAFFLSTSDFQTDYKLLKRRGLKFLEEPRYEVYGSVCVFEDIYGNTWDLIQHNIR